LRIVQGFILVFLLSVGFTLFAQYPDSIRLNDVRIIASHNSYKKNPDQRVLRFLSRFKKRLGNDLDPKRMDYGHVSLTQQFDEYEVRGIELDLYFDPKGGKYKKRRVNLFVSGKKQRIKDPIMKQAGFKMLHIADVDFETNYLTFKQGLEEIAAWSKANPNHTPLIINIEPKDDSPGDYSGVLRFLGFKRAVKYDSTAYLLMEQEILESLDRTTIYTPDELSANFSSVSERLDALGWPRLNDVLGKVIFVIDGDGKGLYRKTSQERLMFQYSDPTDSSTAFVKRNDPIGHELEIKELTDKYIVRTRSDVETIQARENDYTMFNAAIDSQAQIISTDYYKSDERLSPFKINLERFKKMKEWPFIQRAEN
jgi:hypothetical protein